MITFIRKKIQSIFNIQEKSFKYECGKLSLIYIAIGFLWVYIFNIAIKKVTINNKALLIIILYKDWIFVIITSVIIYFFIRKLVLAISRDITIEKKAEEAIKSSEYTVRKLFESSSDAILIIENNKVLDCNLSMVKLLGCDSKNNVINKNPNEIFLDRQPDGELSIIKMEKMYSSALKDGKCKFEWWYKNSSGELFPAEVMMTTILLKGEIVFHTLWRDINDRKRMERKLQYLSYHDQLTGLNNRRFFEEQITNIDVEDNWPLTMVMADVNGLKLVNDSFGHAMGDELLKKVVEIINSGCRKKDLVARLAGDEFIILMPNTNFEEASEVIKKISMLASKEKVGSIEVSISFGHETKVNKNDKLRDIFKKAEDCMYNKKMFESQGMRGRTINAIISTLNEKNKREEQHSIRVSKLCEDMGRALKLPKGEINELKTVGLLHDIGKIAIDEKILNKPAKLTKEEFEEIKKHPEIGYRILSTVNEMSELSRYVLAHHEKWNGNGYPKGLKCEEIPFQSRIISLADAYDAMISERSYGVSMSKEAAIQELKVNAGSQFDPKLTRIFIEKVLVGEYLTCIDS